MTQLIFHGKVDLRPKIPGQEEEKENEIEKEKKGLIEVKKDEGRESVKRVREGSQTLIPDRRH